jgi:hypothetical protein
LPALPEDPYGILPAMIRIHRIADACAGLECVYETKRAKPGMKAGAVENLHRRLGTLSIVTDARNLMRNR